MLPYLILFGVFAAAAAISGINDVPRSNRWLVLAALILVLMVGLRRDVGADWENYLRIFWQIKASTLGDAMTKSEPGYALLNIIAGKLGWGIWFPNLVCAALFIWGLAVFSREQPNPALALLVAVPYLIIGVGMAFTRQSAALGFVFLALTQYTRGASGKMAVSIVFAVLFHTSALAVIPLLALAALRRGIGTVAIVTFVGGFLFFQLFGRILVRLAVFTEGEFIASGAVPRLAMNLVPALIFIAFRGRFTANLQERRLWAVFSVGVLFSIVLLFYVRSSTLVDRIGIYFIPLQLYVLSRVPIVFGNRPQQNMLLLLAIVGYSLAVQLVWFSSGSWSHAWLPYQNYLTDSWFGIRSGD